MATISAIVVEPNGDIQRVEIDGHYTSLQHIIGGYIEGVYSNKWSIWVDEEGLMKGLPFNKNATDFANTRRNVTLFGTAVIMGKIDGHGNNTSVSQETIDYFYKGA